MRILLFCRYYSMIPNNVLNLTFYSYYNFRKRFIVLNKFNQVKFLALTYCLRTQEKSHKMYEVTFVRKNGERIKVEGKEGDSLLDLVVNNNLDFDGYGACEGTLTCSTCHVILKKEDYEKLPDKPNDEELDMLDLAYELTETSRLGCQIILNKSLDGLEVQLPSSINDARN